MSTLIYLLSEHSWMQVMSHVHVIRPTVVLATLNWRVAYCGSFAFSSFAFEFVCKSILSSICTGTGWLFLHIVGCTTNCACCIFCSLWRSHLVWCFTGIPQSFSSNLAEVGIQKLSWFLCRNNDGSICLDVSMEIQQFRIPPSQRCSPALTEPEPKEVMIQDWKALVLARLTPSPSFWRSLSARVLITCRVPLVLSAAAGQLPTHSSSSRTNRVGALALSLAS